MAVPFRRVSVKKKRMRRSHSAIVMPSIKICENCGASKLNHRICKTCGFFKNKLVLKPKDKSKKKAAQKKRKDRKKQIGPSHVKPIKTKTQKNTKKVTKNTTKKQSFSSK